MQSARGALLQKVSAGDFYPPLKDLFVPRRLRGVGHLRHGYKGCRLALRQFLLEIFLIMGPWEKKSYNTYIFVARDMLVSGEWLNSVQYDIIET